MDPALSGPLALVLLVAAVLLVVCWIVLPFAVIGTKPLLKALLREQRRTNDLLAEALQARRQRQ